MACGSASNAQNTLSAETGNFYQELSGAYQQQFGQYSSILDTLHNAWTPVLNGGIGQEGWTPQEAAAMNTQTINTVGANYKNAANATAEALAARGGGNEYLPSGTADAVQAGVAEKAAQELSTEQNQNTIANYNTGRSNFLAANGALSSVASEDNPLGFASTASGTGNQAFQQATQINTENNSWMNDLTGALTGVAGAWAGGGFKLPGGGNPSGPSALTFATPGSADYGQPG